MVQLSPGSGLSSGAGLAGLAGTIAFLGSMKEAKSFPPNGVRIIFATLMLVVVVSLFDRGPLASPIKALGMLMVLGALIRYVPKLSKKG
jgi:hypothetical protein